MKKAGELPRPKEGASGEELAPDNAYAQLGETWNSAMAPWLSWLGVLNSTVQSRAAPMVESVTRAMMRPDRVLENLGPLSEGLRQMIGLPQFADLPDFGASIPSFEPTIELMGVMQQYLRIATPIWIEACKCFEAEAARRHEKGEALDSASEALELWNNTVDRTLMEFNRSSEFAELQQRYLRVGIRQKLETRRYFEQLAKMVDYPTRAELDDVYRRLHELRREVVSLRRKLDDLNIGPAIQETPSPRSSKVTARSGRKARSPRR
jgi:Poly(R)-hydroxyalkanoic acid synthase subunit (PHA_synth_III_E)